MIILAVETSCDDTCAALIKVENSGFKILSDIISSQVKIHAKYGGVYPFLAKREHQKNLPSVLKKAISLGFSNEIDRKFPMKKIDLIGVTAGPGLEPCLWQGINFAKEISKKHKKPLISVNHIEAHILANFTDKKFNPCFFKRTKNSKSNFFPAVCLIVSGGHTQLILVKEIGKYKLIGETRDDAAGECFDKAARILGLKYPGGPVIAAEALKFKPEKADLKYEIKLPRPMIYTKDYDFSFSGLKTAVLYDFKKRNFSIRKSKKYVQRMCFEIQQAIIDVLILKTLKAVKDFKAKSLILGGGVAANDELRKQFQSSIKNQKLEIKFLAPPKNFCTDNAVMTAIAAFFRRNKKIDSVKIKANANLKI